MRTKVYSYEFNYTVNTSFSIFKCYHSEPHALSLPMVPYTKSCSHFVLWYHETVTKQHSGYRPYPPMTKHLVVWECQMDSVQFLVYPFQHLYILCILCLSNREFSYEAHKWRKCCYLAIYSWVQVTTEPILLEFAPKATHCEYHYLSPPNATVFIHMHSSALLTLWEETFEQ